MNEEQVRKVAAAAQLACILLTVDDDVKNAVAEFSESLNEPEPYVNIALTRERAFQLESIADASHMTIDEAIGEVLTDVFERRGLGRYYRMVEDA